MGECTTDVKEVVGIILSFCLPCLSSSVALIRCEKNFGVLADTVASSLRVVG